MLNLNEDARLEKLLSYNILDTPEENDFDELVNLASRICKTPISLISLIDDKRQWFKAHYGLAERETPKDISFCQHAIKDEQLFIVNDALLDARFSDNPLVLGAPDIRFYAGMPLTTTDGFNLGTLCVIDTVPRILSEEQKESLRIISKQVTKQLDLKISIQKERELNLILNKNQAELQEANSAKDKLFGIVAHDLRAPINNIKAMLSLYEKGDIDEQELKEFLSNLSAKVNETTEMLENLLSWAKSQLSNALITRTKVNISDIVTSEINKNKKTADAKGISLDSNVAEDFIIWVDSDMISMVLRNLLSNAIKFCKKNDSITITVQKNDNQLLVSVKDSGLGISKENLDKLFNNNDSISTFGTNKEKGIGIGLNLCKTFLNKNNGDIWVESEENKGSTFTFSLPLEAGIF
ncbi:MAG: ATP-binding protein [Candidatus Methylacidiphilales bacterium]